MSIEDKQKLYEALGTIQELKKEVSELRAELEQDRRNAILIQAKHFESLFANGVLFDSIAARVLNAAANALVQKANQSTERAPELVITDKYFPGVERIRLNEDGSLDIWAQVRNEDGSAGDWESKNEQYAGADEALAAFAHMAAASDCEVGKFYYLTDTVTQQQYRQELARQLASAKPTAAEDAGDPDPGYDGSDDTDDLSDDASAGNEGSDEPHAEPVKGLILTTVPASLSGEADAEAEPVEVVVGAEVVITRVRTEDGGTEEVSASELNVGDMIQVSRNGSVLRESIIAIK